MERLGKGREWPEKAAVRENQKVVGGAVLDRRRMSAA